MHCHIENLSGEFRIIILTKTHPEGGRAGGKMAKMNAWEGNVSKTKLSNKSPVKFLRLAANAQRLLCIMIRCGGHWPACPVFNLA